MSRTWLAIPLTVALLLIPFAPAAMASEDAGPVATTHGADPVTPLNVGSPGGQHFPILFGPEPWSTLEWDGKSYSADQPDLPGRSGLPAFHVVYMHPRDRGSRFDTYAAMFQANARQASRAFRALTGGYDLRFDERLDTRDPASRLIDITVVRSRLTTRQLTSSRQFDLVASELQKQGFYDVPDKKYVVFLDAPPSGLFCGQGTLYGDGRRSAENYSNELPTLAIVYKPGDSPEFQRVPRELRGALLDSGGWRRGRTLLHELGHNMGAVISPRSPVHCGDDYYDVMCVDGPDIVEAVDFGRDDYWDPVPGIKKLPWWTINLSKFLCPPPGEGEAMPACEQPNRPSY